jgi:hypothetical protein
VERVEAKLLPIVRGALRGLSFCPLFNGHLHTPFALDNVYTRGEGAHFLLDLMPLSLLYALFTHLTPIFFLFILNVLFVVVNLSCRIVNVL